MQSNNSLPRLDSREMQRLKSEYPSIAHLEAGDTARWLVVRKEDLLSKARDDRTGMNLSKVVTLAGTLVGGLCYAISPLGIPGAIVSGAGYAWAVLQDMNDSHMFCPLPFVRGDFFEFMQAMGDADTREEYMSQQNELADLMNHLEPLERKEFAMLTVYTHNLSDYLNQVPEGKRFYAYRWLFQWFIQLEGNLPSIEMLNNHMASVQVDTAINYQHVQALKVQQEQVSQYVVDIPGLSSPLPTRELPSAINPNVYIPGLSPAPIAQSQQSEQTQHGAVPSAEVSKTEAAPAPTAQSQQAGITSQQKALKVIEKLEQDGFKIKSIMKGQVIGMAGTQRGGKGTLAGVCAILNLALDPTQTVEYFTAGVDIYPFKCRLHCALSYPNLDIQDANKHVARDLLAFLEMLANSEPYSHTGLILVIDECMTLLKLLESKKRAWAIEYLLSNIAKTGACVIFVLHANNLTAIAGEETSGLAATFQESIHFVGCKAQSVPMPNNPMRSINVASGEYFLADVKNFGKAVADGELGQVPAWLKTETNPGTKQPDPVRSLLKFFPEYLDSDKSSVVKGGYVPLTAPLSTECDDFDIDYTHETFLQPQNTVVQESTVNDELLLDKNVSESVTFDIDELEMYADIIEKHIQDNSWQGTSKTIDQLRRINRLSTVGLCRHLNRIEARQVLKFLTRMRVVSETDKDTYTIK